MSQRSFPYALAALLDAAAVAARSTLLVLALMCCVRAAEPTKVRLCAGPNFIAQLAAALGYFRGEGLDVRFVDFHDFVPEDAELYVPLNDGRMDAAVHWYQHVFMGAGEGKPLVGVMVFNDAPGVTVFVANRVKGQIKTPADFKGRPISTGLPMTTKSYITNYLTVRSGLPPHSYHSVFPATEGRQDATIEGLRNRQVDVVTSLEPQTTAYAATGLVTRMYDFTTRAATVRELGASMPGQALLVSRAFIEAHPETVQRLVNAFVRAMRFSNRHTPAEIAALLPPSYFAGSARDAGLQRIKDLMHGFARDNYAFGPADVALIRDAIFADTYTATEWGRLLSDTRRLNPPLETYYDNRIVNEAMAKIRSD